MEEVLDNIGYCDCCGENHIIVKTIHTTVSVLHMCLNCLSDFADLYLGSE